MGYFTHEHNGTDAPRIPGKSVLGAPQDSLTEAESGSLSTGGAAVLSTDDSAILSNAITRLGELETRLQNLGLLS